MDYSGYVHGLGLVWNGYFSSAIIACHYEGFCLWKSDAEVYLDGARKGFEAPKFEILSSEFETNSKKK